MAMAGTDTELAGEDTMADTVTHTMVMAGEATEVMEDTAWVMEVTAWDMEDTGVLTDTQDTHTMDMEVMVAMVATVATDMEVMDTVDMDHITTTMVAMDGDTTAVLSDTIVDFLLDMEVPSKNSGDP